MRLGVVENGHTFGRKALLLLIRIAMRARAPDVVRTLMYRPDFFGNAMNAWTQQVMRGPSEWTVGQRELMAAFTSKLNQCLF